jgi:hypothetical protein
MTSKPPLVDPIMGPSTWKRLKAWPTRIIRTNSIQQMNILGKEGASTGKSGHSYLTRDRKILLLSFASSRQAGFSVVRLVGSNYTADGGPALIQQWQTTLVASH